MKPGNPLRLIPLRFLALTALLGGCAGQIPKDEGSPWYQVPVGSLVRLHQKVEVPPGRTRVFFQHGKVTLGFDSYVPNCNLEVRRLDPDAVQYVEPGAYPVTRVQRTLEEVVQARGIQVAALGLMVADRDDGGAPMVYEGYHLWLDGADENLMRLSCRGVFGEMHRTYPPSIAEMREALGEIASLELKSE